ncbi:hypothetical protein D3C86_1792140 [compost metagenome]
MMLKFQLNLSNKISCVFLSIIIVGVSSPLILSFPGRCKNSFCSNSADDVFIISQLLNTACSIAAPSFFISSESTMFLSIGLAIGILHKNFSKAIAFS